MVRHAGLLEGALRRYREVIEANQEAAERKRQEEERLQAKQKKAAEGHGALMRYREVSEATRVAAEQKRQVEERR